MNYELITKEVNKSNSKFGIRNCSFVIVFILFALVGLFGLVPKANAQEDPNQPGTCTITKFLPNGDKDPKVKPNPYTQHMTRGACTSINSSGGAATSTFAPDATSPTTCTSPGVPAGCIPPTGGYPTGTTDQGKTPFVREVARWECGLMGNIKDGAGGTIEGCVLQVVYFFWIVLFWVYAYFFQDIFY